MFTKLNLFYNLLPRFIQIPIAIIVNLVIPLIVFFINYNYGWSVLSSLIGAILFTLALFTIIIFILFAIAFVSWIYDGFKLFQDKFNSFEGSKILTPTKILNRLYAMLKSIFSYTNISIAIKKIIEFICGLAVVILLWSFLLGMSLEYIYETLLRVF